MKDSLIRLCKLHDEIKKSDIRISYLNDDLIYDDSKEKYYKELSFFLNEVLLYINKFQKEDHVKYTLRWGVVRGNIPRLLEKELEKAKQEQITFDDFIAYTEINVLVKLHSFIEKMYYLLTGEWYTPGFHTRID